MSTPHIDEAKGILEGCEFIDEPARLAACLAVAIALQKSRAEITRLSGEVAALKADLAFTTEHYSKRTVEAEAETVRLRGALTEVRAFAANPPGGGVKSYILPSAVVALCDKGLCAPALATTPVPPGAPGLTSGAGEPQPAAPLVQTFLNDDDFHPVTCVKCGHVGGLKVSLSELSTEMMRREERNGFDRGWKAAVAFMCDGNQALLPTDEPAELRRRAGLAREAVEADARKLEDKASAIEAASGALGPVKGTQGSPCEFETCASLRRPPHPKHEGGILPAGFSRATQCDICFRPRHEGECGDAMANGHGPFPPKKGDRWFKGSFDYVFTGERVPWQHNQWGCYMICSDGEAGATLFGFDDASFTDGTLTFVRSAEAAK